MSSNPTSPAQWQEAVDAAHALLALDAARYYGLVFGPNVNVARCEEILRLGAELGIEPSPNAIDRMLQ